MIGNLKTLMVIARKDKASDIIDYKRLFKNGLIFIYECKLND